MCLVDGVVGVEIPGCGKSTLLRAILGTHPLTEGQVRVAGKVVEQPARDVGIVYQLYSLSDFLTA
ncbi:MAG: hypothetical protein CMJ58_24645 [Planctomycetaceae bacterium]|nr:hypothetical protein [Planctomycetaceae bacterium]